MRISVSIVTISYNQVDYLKQCLESILNQEVPVEYIVMDGGSTDGSAELISQHEDRIKYWISQKDGGAPNALNAGLPKLQVILSGILIVMTFYCLALIRALVEIIERNPGYDVYYGPGYIRNETSGKTDLVKPTLWHLGIYRSGYSVMFATIYFHRT
jgi:glycosyltransferase involved in cell wall biosynthesis